MMIIRKAFTLVELLVSISIIAVLLAILLPTLGKVRQHARCVVGMENQRQIVGAVNSFALDHNDRYPESVATIGVLGGWWNWQEPMMMTGYQSRSPRLHRSLSAYLGAYIKKADVFYCPSAPGRYRYLQASWDAADSWDNPDTAPLQDPVIGTYCFYWNYTGYLPGRQYCFHGPRNISGGRYYSKLLVSDYFGFDHWRSPGAYGSCEHMKRASIAPGTDVSSDYWARLKTDVTGGLDSFYITLNAGFTDGHVEAYSPAETSVMQVSITSDGTTPYPSGAGPGDIYLPRNGLR